MWTHQDLIDALTSGDPDRTGPALGRLLAHPRHLAALDDRVRRRYRWDERVAPQLARVADEVRRGGGDAGLVALASLHPDGRIREVAVRRITALRLPELTPWLVLRTADWVEPVRDLARTALTRRLDQAPATYGPPAAPMALLLAARSRGPYARRQLAGALADPAPAARRGEADLFALLLASPVASVRLFALRHGGGRLGPRELLALALDGADPHLRYAAAESAARAAVWTGQAEPLQRLARSRQGTVRATALTGLARIGQLPAVAAYLDDPDPLVRAQARDAARRTGADPVGHYRTRVEKLAASDAAGYGGRDALAVIDGLAETGGRGDVPLLVRLLDHPADAVRARALRGLRQLAGTTAPVADVLPLLHDRSPRVVRAAAELLRPVVAELPDGLARDLLADPDRTVVRRAGYRLLHEPDHTARLAVLLRAAADPDPRLAGRATADAVELIRRAAGHYWRSAGVRLRPDGPDTRAELLALARAVTERIGAEQVDLLERVLADPK